MRSVILYNPRSSASRKPVLPMSLLALGAVLEGRRPYRIVDGNLEDDPLGALDGLVREGGAGTVLGVTVMPGPQLSEAVPLCRELKARHPRLTVVWGGYFPSQHWDSCLAASYVDVVVRGHGERAFAALLDHLDGAGPGLSEIPGIAYRDASGAPVGGEMAPVPSPAELPDWPLPRVPVERYARPTFLGSRTLGYHSSYGCPFRCNFCAVVNLVDGRWLAQPAERVAQAFETYGRRFGVDAVELNDNNFFTAEARVLEFASRVERLGMAWWGEGRIDTMLAFAPGTWRAMKASGLRMVFLGAESASEETLARMDKGGRLTPDQTLEMVELMRGHGIVPELSFVVGNPPDPDEDAARTIDFVRKVKARNPLTEIILYLYTPVPLSGDLYDQARQAGFAFPRTLEEWVSPEWAQFSQRRSGRLPWLGDPVRARLRDFERVLNAYHPTSAMPMSPWRRRVLRAASAWRYRTGIYRASLELSLLQGVMRYRRPETAGF